MEKYERITDKRLQIGRFYAPKSKEERLELVDSINKQLTYENIYTRLAELEDKIENGTLVELPCKVGDTVYRVMADKRIKQPYEYKVIGFWYSINNKCNDLHLGRYIDGVFVSFISVPFSEFNRMLFLTKAEAEKKLKERQDEKK